jgi:uncharacterized GH25 family protein
MITRSRSESFCSVFEPARLALACLRIRSSAMGSFLPRHFRKLFVFALTWVCAAVGAPRAFSHDTWLEPDAFFAQPGQEIAVSLRLGDHLRVEEQKPLRHDAITRFQVSFASPRKRPLDLLSTGQEGQIPVGHFKSELGGSLLVMDRAPRRISLDAEKFNAYLSEENLATIQAQRAQLGQNGQPGRERYARYLKALVQEREVSNAPGVLYRRRSGQRLEILLLNDPGKLRAGQKLAVKVVFDNRPLVGAKIAALHRDRDNADARGLTATTDSRGRASLAVDAAGFWLVRTVHMRAIPPAERRDGDDSQWESFWANFAFGVRQLAASPGPARNPIERSTPPLETPGPGPARRPE